MNCCDYECNQGPQCPARVAKVKARIPGPEPLPPSRTHTQLRHLAGWMLVSVLAALLGLAIVTWGLA